MSDGEPPPATVIKDLYILVGQYETSTEQILKELKDIKSEFSESRTNHRKEHGELQKCVTALTTKTQTNEMRITAVEETGVPKKTNQKIDASLILGVINGIITIVKAWFGVP